LQSTQTVPRSVGLSDVQDLLCPGRRDVRRESGQPQRPGCSRPQQLVFRSYPRRAVRFVTSREPECATLDHTADRLQPPRRDINSPLRFPISNVFKGQSSTTGVSGRLCGGLVQVGERLRVLPGDETAVVKGYSDFSLSFF
jgi:hypothetical protein